MMPMISSLHDKLTLPKYWLPLVSLLTSASLVSLLCFFFEPRWETNDDVGMSMIAHGYGIATVGLPNLIFSNVLWGYLVRALPEINGVLGYSIATLSVLVIVGAVVIYGLYQLGANYITCLSILALILVRPVLFPQFTINAGLLMVGAIICWQLYTRQNDRKVLLLGCFLAFCSYLVRNQEFLLVLIVALPLLSWRELFLHRFAKIAFLTLIVAIAVSAAIDHQAYQGDEWDTFKETGQVLRPLVDFGASALLKQRPDVLESHGYSVNDIDLIANWFFVDPHILNPQVLRAMLDELGSLPTQDNALTNAWIGVKTLWHPNLLPLTIIALLLTALRPSWQLVLSWGLCIVAVFTLGLLGRPGVLRIYVPLASLLVVAPFLVGKITVWHKRLGEIWLLVVCLLNMSNIFSDIKASQIATSQIRKNLVNFPKDAVIVWASEFPLEAVYPVLVTPSATMSYKLYGLGGATLAPFSHHFADQKLGRGMTDLLVKETGVPIVAHFIHFELLRIYCNERLHGQLKELFSKQYGTIVLRQLRCEVTP